MLFSWDKASDSWSCPSLVPISRQIFSRSAMVAGPSVLYDAADSSDALNPGLPILGTE